MIAFTNRSIQKPAGEHSKQPSFLKPIFTTTSLHRFLLIPLATLLMITSAHAGRHQIPSLETAPDLTHGGQADESHDWTLGPTGARGWIFTAFGHSHQARQILITDVAKGSPADGVLTKGDVILGVDGKNFDGDARVQYADAIAAAEANHGVLHLLRWRDQKTDPVELKLQVLGSYSATAPYNCPKSEHILDLGCQALVKRMVSPGYARGMDPIPRCLNALALLASGNKEWLPMVKRETQWAADFSADEFSSWYYGYAMMLVSEYVIATNDTSVLPGLKRLALAAAHGQSAVGTWGHKFANPNGNVNGYGSMNHPGLTLMIGMALAREAGASEPDIDAALSKGAAFTRWYVNKGAVPYGDHQPFPGHEDNGKCSSAAVLYDLLGDREATEYFAKMTTAGYSERERGHTGNFFNILWALPGVARGGPLATGAYLKEDAWYYDLARSWDGSFLYQGSPVGEEEHGKYAGWDCTGGYLLAYALPLKSLRITGKKPSCIPTFDAQQVQTIIQAGRDYGYREKNPVGYGKRTTDELMAGLSSWSPAVRKRSATELNQRDGDFVPALLKMLESGNRDARYGACEALGALGPKADTAGPALKALLKDADPWMQCLAATSLAQLGDKVRKDSVNDLLALAVSPNPADPRRMIQRSVSEALFAPFPGRRDTRSILTGSLNGVDRRLLYPVMQSMLDNEDSVTRSSIGQTYDRLSAQDLAVLLPSIFKAVVQLAPSDEMFGDRIRLSGLDLLSKLHIRESLPLCVSMIEPDRWGANNRLSGCLESLKRYGSYAKPLLPELKKMRDTERLIQSAALIDQTIAEIESSNGKIELVSMEDFIAHPTLPQSH